MTDRIDLDEFDEVADDESDDANPGDWFWRGDGDPADEPPLPEASATRDGSENGTHRATPRVPRSNDDAPVGIPVERGGAGSGQTDAGDRPGEGDDAPTGHHGGGPADMTMALTYRAARRLTNLPAALADAEGWTDYVGLVGDVESHVLQTFQREERVDVDFFNGSGTGPAERLASVDERSMFYADRMAVVGVDDEEWIAEESGWEFVPLAEAAENAGWELS